MYFIWIQINVYTIQTRHISIVIETYSSIHKKETRHAFILRPSKERTPNGLPFSSSSAACIVRATNQTHTHINGPACVSKRNNAYPRITLCLSHYPSTPFGVFSFRLVCARPHIIVHPSQNDTRAALMACTHEARRGGSIAPSSAGKRHSYSTIRRWWSR